MTEDKNLATTTSAPAYVDVEGHPESVAAVNVEATAGQGQERPPNNGASDTTTSSSHRQECLPCCSCWRTFCSFPQLSKSKHARRIWTLVFISTIVAIALCDAGTDVCGFVQATVFSVNAKQLMPHSDDNADNNNQLAPIVEETRGVGINTYEDSDGECISWRKGNDKDWIYSGVDVNIDGDNADDILWVVVRYWVGIASVVAVICCVVFAFVPCVVLPLCLWNIFAYSWSISWFLYSLSFIVFGSDLCALDRGGSSCTFDIGAALILAGVIVWIPSTLGVWYLTKVVASAVNNVSNDDEADEEQVEGQEAVSPVPPPSLVEDHTNDSNRKQTENGTQKGWWIGWVIVTSILVVASFVTNVVLITIK